MALFRIRKLELYPIIGYIIAGLIVYTNIHEQLSNTSLLISCSFIYVFLGLVLYFNKLRKDLLLPIILCVVLSFINVTIVYVGDFDYYKKVIMFGASMFWMLVCCSIHINKRTVGIILLINLLVSFLYLVNFKEGYSITEEGLLLTFNFTNANQAGMFLLNTALYLCVILFTDVLFSKLLIRLLVIPVIGAILTFVFMTGCRSSIGAFAFFLFLVVVDFASKGGLKLKKWHLWVWSLSPFLFVLLYVLFIKSIDLDLSFGIEDHGKNNDTRLGVWLSGLKNLPGTFLFGDYPNVEKVTSFSHLHNVHLDVIFSYGLVPFILYVISLFKSAWITTVSCYTRIQRLSLYAFFTCFVSGFFEATLVSGSGGLFLFSFGFLLLANMNGKDVMLEKR